MSYCSQCGKQIPSGNKCDECKKKNISKGQQIRVLKLILKMRCKNE